MSEPTSPAREPLDVVYTRDFQRALATAKALLADYQQLRDYLKQLRAGEALDDDTISAIFELATASFIRRHPIVIPRAVEGRIPLGADGKPPSGYTTRAAFEASVRPQPELIRRCQKLQQELVNALARHVPAMDVAPLDLRFRPPPPH